MPLMLGSIRCGIALVAIAALAFAGLSSAAALFSSSAPNVAATAAAAAKTAARAAEAALLNEAYSSSSLFAADSGLSADEIKEALAAYTGGRYSTNECVTGNHANGLYPDLSIPLPWDHAHPSKGAYDYSFTVNRNRSSDVAFVFLRDERTGYDTHGFQAASFFYKKFEARYNATFFHLFVRGDNVAQSELKTPQRSTFTIGNAVRDLDAVLTSPSSFLSTIPRIVLIGSGRAGAVAARYRYNYADKNPRVVGAIVDTPYFDIPESVYGFADPVGAPAACLSVLTAATKALAEALKTAEGRTRVKADFNLCTVPDVDMEVYESLFWLAMMHPIARALSFVNTQPTGSDKLHRDGMCDYLVKSSNGTSPLAALGKVHVSIRDSTLCYEADYSNFFNGASETSRPQRMLGLDLMHMCSGSAPFVVASSVSSFLLMPRRKILLGHYDSFCREYLGPNFSVKYARTAASAGMGMYGSLSMVTELTSNVFYVASRNDVNIALAPEYTTRRHTTSLYYAHSGLRGHVFKSEVPSDSSEIKAIRFEMSAFIDNLLA